MPAVESRYRTADARGFAASREHRAFGGSSMGAVNTWYAFIESSTRFKYFMPMAGDSWVLGVSGGGTATEEIASYLDDVARDSHLEARRLPDRRIGGLLRRARRQIQPQVRAMWRLPSFDHRNLRVTLDPGGDHDSASLQEQLYNSLPLLFRETR